jgi:GntR family transcriptional regulator, vanillate catabolism transcriptional regulator
MSNSGHNVISALRQMILTGALSAGERLAEIPTAERLGVSRTPVRLALRALEQEGLLTKLPRRGFEVRALSSADIAGAVEVRGVLEGLAARQAAERGMTSAQQAEMRQLLAIGDHLFQAKALLTQDDLTQYQAMNKRFHQLIIEAAGNPSIQLALARHEHLPFASASALVFDKANLARETKRFEYAHYQHHHVFQAIVQGHGARAEGIMREHAQAALGFIHSL